MAERSNNSRLINAAVVLCRCQQTKSLYGIRAEQESSSSWKFTWAFKLNEKSAEKEGFGHNRILGQVNHDISFPGCPYCGNQTWFKCNICDKLTCTSPESTYVRCAWCGDAGPVQAVENFNLSAGDL